MKKGEFFDMHIQVVENMSDDNVTIYTSPANKHQIECMILHLQNMLSKNTNEEGCDE